MNTLFETPFSFKEPVSDSESLISIVVLACGSTAWRPGPEENESDTRPCLKRKESSRKLNTPKTKQPHACKTPRKHTNLRADDKHREAQVVCECVCTQGEDNTVISVLLCGCGSSLRGSWEVFSWLHVLLEVSNHCKSK